MSIIEGVKRLAGRSSDFGPRLEALHDAVEASRGRLSDEAVADAEAVVERAAARLRLSAEHTVVALAGATGSGKSSMFNALVGIDIAKVGVRRPTTSWTSACVWGSDGAGELLQWLEIPERHRTIRDAGSDVLDQPTVADKQLEDVVLLDLPDHDSTEVAHHLEVDRLVKLADLVVWVVDPQKYADAAIHTRYLTPLATHQETMLVLLNRIDTVPPERRKTMVGDLRRILDQNGLTQVPIMTTSAREDLGVAEVRTEIARRAKRKRATRDHLSADITAAAQTLEEEAGRAETPKIASKSVRELNQALAESAGVPIVAEAVRESATRRANRATGWPLVSWLSKLKPDPLRRLHLDIGAHGEELRGRTSVPEAMSVQAARLAAAVRGLSEEVGAPLAAPWQRCVREASLSRSQDLGDRLDAALSTTDLGVHTLPGWVRFVRFVQWLLIFAAIAGGLWLAGLAGMSYLQMPRPGTPELGPLPVPTWMLIGGVAAGIVLALLCRLLVALSARKRARKVDKDLRAAIAAVSDELIIEPIAAELDAHRHVMATLVRAQR